MLAAFPILYLGIRYPAASGRGNSLKDNKIHAPLIEAWTESLDLPFFV